MKNRKHIFICVFVILLANVFISCGASDEPNAKSARFILTLSLKDAVLSSSLDPTAQKLITALDSAGQTDQTTTKDFINRFVDYYQQHFSATPLETLFDPETDSTQHVAPDTIKSVLLKRVNKKRSQMNEVITARLQNLCNIPARDVKISHEGSVMIVQVDHIKDKEQVRAAIRYQSGVRLWAVYQLSDIAKEIFAVDSLLAKELDDAQTLPADTSPDSTASLIELADRGRHWEERQQPLFRKLTPTLDSDGHGVDVAPIGSAASEDTAAISDYLARQHILALFPAGIRFLWGLAPYKTTDRALWYLYALKPENGRASIIPDDLEEAHVEEISGQVELALVMNARGAFKFAKTTEANMDHYIAIELNGLILSAPHVMSKITGGRLSITAGSDMEDFSAAAATINSGNFPMAFRVAEEKTSTHTKTAR